VCRLLPLFCRYVIEELLTSEKDYVEKLCYCIEVCSMCVCCVCMHACVRACVHLHVNVSVCMCVCTYLFVSVYMWAPGFVGLSKQRHFLFVFALVSLQH